MSSLYKTLIVKEIRKEVEGFKVFVLEDTDGRMIDYKAGQYLTFVHRLHDEEIRRSYSIVSSPVLREPLAIGVRRVNNGFFSRHLIDHIKTGDAIITIGSGGFFILPEDIKSFDRLFFLAAGSGITPVISLIKTALAEHSHLSIVLIYSSHSLHDTIFYRELTSLESKHRHRFQIEFLFSVNPDLYKAHLHSQLLHQFLNQYSAGSGKTLFYTCGPESYMRMCVFTLKEAQVRDEHIKKEVFFTNKRVPLKQVPEDQSRHKVNIRIKERVYDINVQYPATILKAAREKGIVLPYSCETGKCGSCAARCISGKVWMYYNEVLTDADLKNGLVLTCTGYPVNGDVQLEIG